MSGKGPLPPVDDPLLEATLAKVTSAAKELSDAAAAAPAAPAPEPAVAPVAAAPSTDPDDEPVLPAVAPTPAPVYTRRAAAPADDDDDDDSDDDDGDTDDRGRPRRPRSRKGVLVGAIALVGGVGIAALVLLGRVNATHYYLACEPERVVAQQGRSFPPWGASALDGKQWAAIKIPPEAECVARETDDPQQLADWYREMLVDRAGTLLTASEVTDTAGASALLQQALLHARSDARRSERQDIERLLGDVDYWRASAKLEDAAAALAEAAKQFDQAAAQRPRHVSDASAWGAFVRQIADELKAGPTGAKSAFPPLPPDATATGTRPAAPPGTTALPVEPEGPSGSAAPPTTASDPAPDAGIPAGGVLL